MKKAKKVRRKRVSSVNSDEAYHLYHLLYYEALLDGNMLYSENPMMKMRMRKKRAKQFMPN